MSFVHVLDSMREILLTKGYSQIPQLSSSRKLRLAVDTFSVTHPHHSPESTRRALLIGINYVGQTGELRGCHNDVECMKRWCAFV